MGDILSRIDVKALKGLTQDSRTVEEGFLFAALSGMKVDGRAFIASAIEKGARVILVPENTVIPECSGVQFVTDANPRRAFALLSSAFYGRQPTHCVAVTGTNGKTSTALFVQQFWQAMGYPAASLGTLGLVNDNGALESFGASMTTPDPVTFHKVLARLADQGVDHLAMEASSHGLDQYRLDGVRIAAAGFTNLTRDHLDYHPDMAAYKAAKFRLFSEVLLEGGSAVLNADAPEFAALSGICEGRALKVLSYGFEGKDLKILHLAPAPHGQNLGLAVFGKSYDLHVPLVGAFQVMNALCALGLVLAQDSEKAGVAVRALEHLQGAKGRLQAVAGHPLGAGIYVDYAHTPDALETVLKAVRPHVTGRLFCVFGCGGDRDKGKRPVMGEIAGRLADHVIVTDDNPRSEIPAQIRAEILAGFPRAEEIPDRHKAIQTAIEGLVHGDVLVIAGKGHEQGQIFATHTDPFDDVDEAQKAIERLKQ